MAIRNRLTQMLEIEHPVLLAPMDIVSGGKLAAAVSQAGGLGLLGGGYGDDDWIDQEWERAGNARIGCDFITWSLANQPYVLERALARRPVAIMLSFGDPRPFARTISALRPFRTVATRPLFAPIASLIGRSGSSAFRPTTTTAVSMSLTGSCFSSESAPGPSIMGVEDEAEQSTKRPCCNERQVQAIGRTHLIHRPARDIIPPQGGARVSSYRM